MATPAAVWRSAVTDVLRDALGPSRSHRTDALLNSLQRGGLGTLNAMQRATEADLVACGCPEDVAAVVLAEIKEPSGFYADDDEEADGEWTSVLRSVWLMEAVSHRAVCHMVV